jgi:hypothetical protein
VISLSRLEDSELCDVHFKLADLGLKISVKFFFVKYSGRVEYEKVGKIKIETWREKVALKNNHFNWLFCTCFSYYSLSLCQVSVL